MHATEPPARPPGPAAAAGAQPLGLGVAAVASIGAGIVHAGAIGVHAEHVGLARLFMVAAVFQIGWGAIALVHPRRWIGAAGAAGNVLVVGGWLTTRIADISWISGLEVHEAPAFADTACAALGVVAAGGGLLTWLVGDRELRVPRLALAALAAGALTLPALSSATSHSHAAAGHTHDAASAATPGATAPHTHDASGATEGDSGAGRSPDAADAARADSAQQAGAAHDHDTAGEHAATVALAPVPYDPTQPIDLGGVAGVTPEQQARAENLVAVTVLRLPQWNDTATAEAAGFRSIGDGFTGFEHYINWAYINDGTILDPDAPESLVYAVDRSSGTKTLVSAMYMLPDGYTLDTVPDIGGALTQWHVHDNLCFAPDAADPTQLRVVGLTGGDGTCSVGTKSAEPNPMIHVWITPHPCGPFAALEGVAAGQVKVGETHACDAAHGSH